MPFWTPLQEAPNRQDLLPHPRWLAGPALPQPLGERIPDLEEKLGRHSQILQALQSLSEQLAQAERQWKKQLGSPGKAGPEGTWVSGPSNIHAGLERLSSLGTGSHGTSGLPVLRKGSKHYTWELLSPKVWRERKAGVKCCRSQDVLDLPDRRVFRKLGLPEEPPRYAGRGDARYLDRGL